MSEFVVIISDVQFPYHHPIMLRNVIRFIGDLQPQEVIQIGDLMDYPQPSRWNKGTKGEFEGGVKRDSEAAQRQILAPLRKVYSGKVTVIEGNHDLRPREYHAKNAPALGEYSSDYDLDKLLNFDAFGVGFERKSYEFTPGWLATHLHLGYSLSRYAGGTAMNAARKCGMSVVGGHTHRLAVISETTGYEGKTKTITGFEVGHLMDIKKASYLKNGAGNWQAGIGVFEIDGTLVRPIPIPITTGGQFVYNGIKYGGK